MAEFHLGFLGGGQLARMSIQAAQRMGLRCLSLDPAKITPATSIAPAISGRLDDPDRIAEIFERCEHVTLENEFIPAGAITDALERRGASPNQLIPTLQALATIQDKLHQRQAYLAAGVPSPLAFDISRGPDEAVAILGFPLVLKARFGGYDGKGTRIAHTPDDIERYRFLWEPGGWLAEAFVPFKRELAVMVWVEANANRCGTFPTMQTVQEDNVCSLVFPSGADASQIALQAVKSIGGVGLFGVELFELSDGSFLINEIAPRPHNTGHFTLDWGGLSQFDVHVRLAMNYPVPENLGTVNPGQVCMANLLGQSESTDFERATAATLQKFPEARFHWYGKAQSRPGRKMGHINLQMGAKQTVEQLVEQTTMVREEFYRAWACG